MLYCFCTVASNDGNDLDLDLDDQNDKMPNIICPHCAHTFLQSMFHIKSVNIHVRKRNSEKSFNSFDGIVFDNKML